MNEMTLGQKVKEARISKQMTQKELAGDFITRNMLSQIENDIATPSIKTIEYIASVLDKPISYFMNDDYSNQISIIQELLVLYKEQSYNDCIETIELYLKRASKYPNNELIDELYINCCLKAGDAYKKTGDFENAKESFNKILAYKKDTTFENNILLYYIYTQLAETNSYLKELDKCTLYNEKSNEIMSKMSTAQSLQYLHILFLKKRYEDVIARADALKPEKLNENDQGRFYMLVGSAYYHQKTYEFAISFFEKAIPYYIQHQSHPILISIYEELSKCYYNLEDYKKAYQLLELAKKYSHTTS